MNQSPKSQSNNFLKIQSLQRLLSELLDLKRLGSGIFPISFGMEGQSFHFKTTFQLEQSIKKVERLLDLENRGIQFRGFLPKRPETHFTPVDSLE